MEIMKIMEMVSEMSPMEERETMVRSRRGKRAEARAERPAPRSLGPGAPEAQVNSPAFFRAKAERK